MLLREITAFVRTVELKSLSAAARSLGISPAAASTRIQKLEEHFELQLLARSTRGLQLTESGRAFLPLARNILESLDQALMSVADFKSTPQGVLRINAPISFGRQFLVPIVCEFHERYPMIDTNLRLSDRMVNLFDEQCDVAFQIGSLADSALIVRGLTDCPFVLCASPLYLQRFGVPSHPDALAEHVCLAQRHGEANEREWTMSEAGVPITVPIKGRLVADCGDV